MKRTARIDNRALASAGLNGASAGVRQTAAPPVGTAALTGDFALALERQGGDTAVLLLAGELDLYRAPDIEMALTEAIGLDLDNDRRQSLRDGQPAESGEIAAEEVRHLAVDLRSVTFIDSSTLALLLAASRHQEARGGDLLVLVGPQTPMTAFQVTGFDRLLTIRHGDDTPQRTASQRAGNSMSQMARHSDSDVQNQTGNQLTQSLYRAVNERIREVSKDFGSDSKVGFLCECGREDCIVTFELTQAQYDGLLSDTGRVLLASEHRASLNGARVLAEYDAFIVVKPNRRAS